jgi:hypothetical protein
MLQEIRKSLLQNDLTIFYSDYGKKTVQETWQQRLKKQVTNLDQFKDYQNINIITGGDSNIVDIDLDCPEALDLADYFLAPTGMMFGRVSTPESHRLYKVIDLTKKHTREFFSFANADKATLVEIRANKHYTMCGGKYDNEELCEWTKYDTATEITYDSLFKQVAKLALACVLLRKAPTPESKKRNIYWWYVAGVLWHYKISEEDCLQIIKAVTTVHGDEVSQRLAKARNVYSNDTEAERRGLPTLISDFNWGSDEEKDLKKLLYKITGRHLLPEFTNEFVNRIAYMMKQKKFYDLEDKEMYDAEAIDIKYAKHFSGKYTPLKFWKLSKDNKVCVDFTYKPDTPQRFVTVNKKLMINIYEKNDLEPDSNADTDLFDALVEHVIPHDDYREHFLNWMAYQIQNPGKKIRHAIIMQSDEFQLGKGSLFDIHRDLLGRQNTRKIDLKEALDKAKGYLVDKQTVLIDEAKASGSWGEKSMFVNTLKTLITEGTAGIRQMYKDYAEGETITNYWINTNYRDAFPLPYNEVRYFVYFSEAKRNEKLLEDFHNERLYGDLNKGVLAQLLDRNISKFKPLGVAPATPYLDEMRKSADRPVADYIREQFKQGIHPFDRDMVTVSELFDWFGKYARSIRVTRQREIADSLKDIGGVVKKSCRVYEMGNFVNVWVIRNHDKYKDLTAKEVGQKYYPFMPDDKSSIGV